MSEGYDFGQLYGQADMSRGIRIPEGVYDAVCGKSEWGRTKDGAKGQWTVETTVTTGQYAGTTLVNTITISPVRTDGTENRQGLGIMFRHLHAFGVPVPPPLGDRGFWELGWREENVAQFMTGKPVQIVVKDDEYDGVTRSKIRDYQPPRPGAPVQVEARQPQQNGYAQQNGYGQPAAPSWGGPGQQPGQPPQQTAPAPWQGAPAQVPGLPEWAQPAAPGQGGLAEFTPQGQSWQPGYGQQPQGPQTGAFGQPGYPPQGQPPYGAPVSGAPAPGAPYQQGAPSPSDQGQPAMPPWAQQQQPGYQPQQPGPANPPADPNAAPPPPWAQ